MNLASIIDPHPDDSVALNSRGRATTYGALREQVDRLRGGLSELGVRDGDRVAILCGNGRYFAISYLASLGLGAVAVPLNPLSPAPELEHQIAEVGAKVVVIEELSAATWSNVDRGKGRTWECRKLRFGAADQGTIDNETAKQKTRGVSTEGNKGVQVDADSSFPRLPFVKSGRVRTETGGGDSQKETKGTKGCRLIPILRFLRYLL